MRYKEVEFNGVTYWLRSGQTVEQLAALLPEYIEFATLLGEIPIVEGSRFILTSQGALVDRSRTKRSHHKSKPSSGLKPRVGPGSGRAGGGRAAAHYSKHVAGGRVPKGTKPEDCYICRSGGMQSWLWMRFHIEEGPPEDLPYTPTPHFVPLNRISLEDSPDVEL